MAIKTDDSHLGSHQGQKSLALHMPKKIGGGEITNFFGTIDLGKPEFISNESS